MDFRELEKESLQVKIPIPIGTILREKAARERRSLSEATTEVLCLALGRKPDEFGIVSRPKAKKAAVTT